MNVVASTDPLDKAKLPDVAAAEPLHVPFVNQSNVTLPDGVNPPELVAEAESCTVEPNATDVTVPWLAL